MKPKTSKSGVKPSRKTRRRPVKFDWLDTLDAVDERCHGLEAVAGLLEACGQLQGTEPLDAVLVSEAGILMLRELKAMQALLKTVWKEMAR